MPNSAPKPCQGPLCGNTSVRKYCEQCRKANTRFILVIGSSGSGKSTYVKNHAEYGDLVIDFDQLFSSISGQMLYEKPESLLGFVLAARDAMLKLIGDVDNVPRAWVVRNKITPEEVSQFIEKYSATVLLMDTPAAVCKQRVSLDYERPRDQITQWLERIDAWNPERFDGLPITRIKPEGLT